MADHRVAEREGRSTRHARRPIVAGLVALAALTVLSRLPQLLSPNLMADGDESVLGLMAKHVAQGREFPIFFYGQRYAFEPVETTTAALGFLAFGVGPMQLKLAGLGLWTAGVLFLFLALSHYTGPGRSFWIAAAFVLNPAWAVWSLREGGGYLTAFAASGALVWLLTLGADGEAWWRWLAAGILTAIVYLSQPLWMPGLAPIVLMLLIARRRLLWSATYVAAAAAVVVLVELSAPPVPSGWAGPAMGNADVIGSLPRVARQIYVYFTGAYYLAWPLDSPGPATTGMAIVWCVLLAGTVLVQGYRVATKQYCLLSHALFAAVWATLAVEWLLLTPREARYLLPLAGLLVPLAGVELIDFVDRKRVPRAMAVALTSAMLLLGAASLVEFRSFNFLWKNPAPRLSEARRLQAVFAYLKAMDVHHVASMNGMLDTQLDFYSDEQIVSRWTDPLGRYHPYVQEVNRAVASGETVAVVGYTHASGAPGCSDVPVCTGGLETMVPNPWRIFTVDGKYFVYVGASRDLLGKLGFRFWD